MIEFIKLVFPLSFPPITVILAPIKVFDWLFIILMRSIKLSRAFQSKNLYLIFFSIKLIISIIIIRFISVKLIAVVSYACFESFLSVENWRYKFGHWNFLCTRYVKRDIWRKWSGRKPIVQLDSNVLKKNKRTITY